MDQRNIVIWNIPFYFFIFLGFFLTLKFIFIFFFRAAFEPRFIFELTPFYFLSGMNNLQLIFLSLLVVASDMFFHINLSKKNLYRSFIPTSCMLAGLGLGIITNAVSISNLPQYLIFGLLLFILVIDHRRTLIFAETLPEEGLPKAQSFLQKIPLPFLARSKPQPSLQAGKPTTSPSGVSSFFNLFKGNRAAKPGRVSVSGISSVLGLFKRGKKTTKAGPVTDEKKKKVTPIEKPSGKEKIVQGKPTGMETSEKKIIKTSPMTKEEKKEKDTQPESQSESIDKLEEDEMPPGFDKWMKEQEIRKKEQDTVIKNLQLNIEEIKKGFESLKIELENISKKEESTPKLSDPHKFEEKRKLENGLLKKFTPAPYPTTPEKITDYKFEKKKSARIDRLMYNQRKQKLQKAHEMLAGMEKRVVKIEQTFNR